MASKQSGALALGSFDLTREKWVNVTWMPHTALSQTSHVCLTIKSAHGSLDDLLSDSRKQPEWKVRIGVFGIGGIPLVPVSTHTPSAPVRSRQFLNKKFEQQEGKTEEKLIPPPIVYSATHDCHWEYSVHVPIRWRDLPRDSYLLFEIVGGPFNKVVYQGAMPFFSRYGKLVTGMRKVTLKSDPLDGGNHGLMPLCSKKADYRTDEDDPVWKANLLLDQLRKREEQGPSNVTAFGEKAAVPWLDELLKERAQELLVDFSRQDNLPLIDDKATSIASLIVELPTFDIPIMHEETFYPVPQDGASGAVTPLDLAIHRKQTVESESNNAGSERKFDPFQLVPFLEYENENDNPVEDKYRTLAHDLIRGLVDPALKPDREQRDQLATIIESPSHHPTREEKDLLWRFRFSLVDNRRALTKFLLAVDWTVESEVVQAAELLEQWRNRSPIEVTDALKLLGKHVAFQTNLVRDYAIDTLAGAPDSELRLYLLQLVQALKYENTDAPEPSTPAGAMGPRTPPNTPPLATFLINRSAGNMQLANYLYWYLKVEVQNPTHGSRYSDVLSALKTKLMATPFSRDNYSEGTGHDASSSRKFKSIVDSVSKIGSTFRGTESHAENDKKHSGKSRSMWDVLVEQDEFISGILDVQKRCREIVRGKKDAKEAELRSILAKEGYSRGVNRNAIPLPSRPEILVNGVHPDTAVMFKSALYPALIEFDVEGTLPGQESSGHERSGKILSLLAGEGHSRYKVIVKTGDDLRQDQLVIMMVQLMDRLLRRAALDLCLTPYSIIATSPSSGLVEFVEGATPISQVLSKHNGSILQFFQTVSPQNGAKYDVRPEVMGTYIRSLAAYCVITYLLGIGDRHLDNIMLRKTGHFFHIDFGFIFGRDPKPLPPAFRLTREMVDGMGGIESSEYRQFCSLACQAYNALRKSAGLVLNLIHLMSDAEIEDLSNNPVGDAETVIARFEERFRLDLTDEQAEQHFTGLITDCLAAIAPRVMDVFHSFAVARR